MPGILSRNGRILAKNKRPAVKPSGKEWGRNSGHDEGARTDMDARRVVVAARIAVRTEVPAAGAVLGRRDQDLGDGIGLRRSLGHFDARAGGFEGRGGVEAERSPTDAVDLEAVGELGKKSLALRVAVPVLLVEVAIVHFHHMQLVEQRVVDHLDPDGDEVEDLGDLLAKVLGKTEAKVGVTVAQEDAPVGGRSRKRH